MIKMKNKEKIGEYISTKLKSMGMTQSGLAERIKELKGDGYDKDSIKDNVCKWVRGKRYPGTEYVYYLAQALKVSIEEILVAGEVCDKYDNRPFTLYAVAKSGNKDALDEMYKSNASTCVGTNFDEFDKTLLDYIVEFENIELIHYMIEKGYLSFLDNHVRLGNIVLNNFQAIVELAIKYDDLMIFKNAISRVDPILIRQDESIDGSGLFTLREYRKGYLLTMDSIKGIFEAPKIFEYLTTPFVPTPEEWQKINVGIIFYRRESRDELKEIMEIETVSASFNLLLNIAILEEFEVADKLVEIAQKHNMKAKTQLERLYTSNKYKIGSEGNVTVDYSGSLTVFAGIIDSVASGANIDGLIRLSQTRQKMS